MLQTLFSWILEHVYDKRCDVGVYCSGLQLRFLFCFQLRGCFWSFFRSLFHVIGILPCYIFDEQSFVKPELVTFLFIVFQSVEM